MPDLPEIHAETYLGDGLYVSFDGAYIRLRAPRMDGDHFVSIEPAVYRKLMMWVAQFPVLWEHFSTSEADR